MIELRNIFKYYGDKLILNDINYTFKNKGLYWLKGKSGCGKTTLLKVISGRCSYRGEVNVSDEVFYLSFNNYLVEELTVKENIELHKDLFSKFKEYKKRFKIDRFIDKKVNKLSMGEKQKVGLFLALSSNCKIILLDEIFSGVDIESRKIFLDEVRKVSKKKLVIIASHQDLDEYDYLIELKEGKIERNDDVNVINKEYKRRLNKSFKWGLLLHRKQIIQRVIFVLSFCSVISFYGSLFNDFNNIKEEIDNTFSSNEIYYKKSNAKLSDESFYDQIVVNLASEIKEYSYSIYSKGMYEVKVSANGYYLGNGALFSNLNYLQGLEENELVLMINYSQYCLDNGYEYCPKNQIRESLIGETLLYTYKQDSIKYLIKDVVEGSSNGIYLTFVEDCLNKIEKFHLKEEILKKYYILVYREKLEEFYKKINQEESLLHYEFTSLYSNDEYEWFLVSESQYAYFSNDQIINKGVIACSDIGYSCSTLDFSKLKSLYYIDNLVVKDKLNYKEYENELDYREVVFSSALLNFLNKQVGDFISLRFYVDESFYVIDNVKIIDYIESEDLTIYHTKYDYLLFKEMFNIDIRIKYLYSENKLDYLISSCLYYEFINETKILINDLLEILKIVTEVFIFIMIGVLFVVESIKVNKHKKMFELIENNNANTEGVYNWYMSFYIFIALFSLYNLHICFIYCFIFLLFYILNKRKIKSRLTLD